MSYKRAMQQYSAYAPKVEAILKPIASAYGIDSFFYTELLPNQAKANFISNQFSIVQQLIQIGQFSNKHDDVFTEINDNHCHKFIWPEDPIDEVGKMLKGVGIRSGVTFLYRSGDLIKSIGFASTQRSDELVNVLVNKNELLHHFIKYFESEAESIIQNKARHFVDFKSNIICDKSYELNNKKMNDCIQSMNIKKLFISSTDRDISIYLTKREYLCLFLLCKGKSTKQISWDLNLSPRSVEFYIQNCKLKFGVYNKFELINRALQIGIDKLCITDNWAA